MEFCLTTVHGQGNGNYTNTATLTGEREELWEAYYNTLICLLYLNALETTKTGLGIQSCGKNLLAFLTHLTRANILYSAYCL